MARKKNAFRSVIFEKKKNSYLQCFQRSEKLNTFVYFSRFQAAILSTVDSRRVLGVCRINEYIIRHREVRREEKAEY